MLVHKRRDMAAALKRLRKLLKNLACIRKQSSATVWRHTLLQSENSGTRTAIELAGCGTIIELKLSSLDPTLGTQTAAVKIARFTPEVSWPSCRHL